MLAFAFGAQDMGRPVVAPGVPNDRRAALRDDFRATMNDPASLEDARRPGLEILDPLRSGRDGDRAAAVRYGTRDHQTIPGNQRVPPIETQGG